MTLKLKATSGAPISQVIQPGQAHFAMVEKSALYNLDDLMRHVVGVINLGTRRIAGFRSEFLVLGAIEDDGTVALLAPDTMSAPGLPVA